MIDLIAWKEQLLDAPIPKEVQARIDYCYGKTPTGRTANRMKANYKKREKK